jgi:hypothetical protein
MSKNAPLPHPFSQRSRNYIERLLGLQGNPWHFRRFGKGTMAELHHLAGYHALVGRLGRLAWMFKLLLTLTWPARLVFQSLPLLRRFGPVVKERYGPSRQRQVFDIMLLGLGYGLPPLAYYQYRLFLPDKRALISQYLYNHEVGALFPWLNGFYIDPAVDDKRLFGERCKAAGLPAVPLLAWAEGREVQQTQDTWPDGDLISKPAVGFQGKGVVLWQAAGPGLYHRNGEAALNRNELLHWLAQSSEVKAWLLQPALRNHPQIADLSPGPLICVRIMTALDTQGNADLFAAVLKMPVGRQTINNHGIGSAIDLESGTLGIAFPYRPLHPGFEHHPTTGAGIVGREVPDWAAVKQLAVTAHKLFPDMRLLGWDIALTADGPVALETNAGWDVAMPQIALQQPLGETQFAKLCEQMLAGRSNRAPSRS